MFDAEYGLFDKLCTFSKQWYFDYSWEYECRKQRTWVHNRLLFIPSLLWTTKRLQRL